MAVLSNVETSIQEGNQRISTENSDHSDRMHLSTSKQLHRDQDLEHFRPVRNSIRAKIRAKRSSEPRHMMVGKTRPFGMVDHRTCGVSDTEKAKGSDVVVARREKMRIS